MNRVKRILHNEVPSEGLGRLIQKRKREVKKLSDPSEMSAVSTGISLSSVRSAARRICGFGKKYFKNAQLVFHDENTGGFLLGLVQGKTKLAASFVGSEISEHGKKQLIIWDHQAMTAWDTNATGKIKACLASFKDENGVAWNVALANAVIKAAYEEGFDRVLLTDITTTHSYLCPKFPAQLEFELHPSNETKRMYKAELKRRRQAMKDLYDETRKKCGFTKDEWVHGKHYWIREFP